MWSPKFSSGMRRGSFQRVRDAAPNAAGAPTNTDGDGELSTHSNNARNNAAAHGRMLVCLFTREPRL
jgi:hypothetical protein